MPLSDVLDRIKDVKGKKAVLVLASGIDTFSRMTLDQTLKRIRETDATIFTVGVAEQFFIAEAPGAFGQQLTYIQAQNQLKTFAAMTGGRSWLPRFDGEIPGIMQEVAQSLRNQYSMAYSPTNETLDGKVPQDQSGVAGAGRRPADRARPEGKEGKVSGLRPARLHRAEIER